MQGQRSIFDPFPEAVDLNQGSNSSNASMEESDDWNNMLSPMERRLLNNDLSNELNFSCVNTNAHNHNFRSFSNWDVGESSSRASLQDQVSNDDSRLQEHQHDPSKAHHHDYFIHHGLSSSSSSSSSSSNHIPMNVNLNIGYGGSNNDDDDDGMGFMDIYKSGKRKALEGTSGQPGQSLTGYNTNLNISSNLVNPVPVNRNEQSTTRVSSVPESSHTHFGMRGYNSSSGNAPRRPNITSSHQSNRQILINEFLDQTSRNNSSNQQPPLMLPRNTHRFPFGSNMGSRNGSLVNSGGYPLERGSTESNFRSLIRNNVQFHNFVPSSETRNSVQDPTNWSLATGSGAPSSSQNSTVWTQHNSSRTMQSQQRLSDFPPWTLFPSSESETGGQRGHFGPFPAGSSSTSEDNHTHISSGGVHGQRHHGQPFSRSSLEVPSDDWRTLAADIEGRQRLISEIRQVLHAMRRGENLRAEDYMLFDPFINGVAELHDRHRDMRLDVDNMSYEELLALEERIGNVNTGLSEDVILKSMKQRKHIAFMAVSTQNLEPCCICQEEYDTGDNIGILDCGHDFHTDCIKQWLSQKNLCPICKMTGLAP